METDMLSAYVLKRHLHGPRVKLHELIAIKLTPDSAWNYLLNCSAFNFVSRKTEKENDEQRIQTDKRV